MKINSFQITNKKINCYITLQLSYEEKSVESNISNNILLNKIANIIYYYNKTRKKIAFIGFPKQFDHVLEKTEHTRIPEFMLNNILKSQIQNRDTKFRKKTSKLILLLKKIPI